MKERTRFYAFRTIHQIFFFVGAAGLVASGALGVATYGDPTFPTSVTLGILGCIASLMGATGWHQMDEELKRLSQGSMSSDFAYNKGRGDA